MINRTGMGFDETKQEPTKLRVIKLDEKRRVIDKRTGIKNETNTVVKTGMKDEPPIKPEEMDNLPRNQGDKIEIPERPGNVRINEGTTEANVPVTGELEKIEPVPVKEVNYNTNTSPLPIIKKISKETKDIVGSAKKTVRKVEEGVEKGLGKGLSIVIPSLKPAMNIYQELRWSKIPWEYEKQTNNFLFALKEFEEQGTFIGGPHIGILAFLANANQESKFRSNQFDPGYLFMKTGQVGIFHFLGDRRKRFLENQFGDVRIAELGGKTIKKFLGEIKGNKLTDPQILILRRAIINSTPNYNEALVRASVKHMIMEINGDPSTPGAISNGNDDKGRNIRAELRKILYGESELSPYEQVDYIRDYYERPGKVDDYAYRRRYFDGSKNLIYYLKTRESGKK